MKWFKMLPGHDVLTRCDCFVEVFPQSAFTPNSYVNNLKFWCSSYKFHFRHEHREKFVSPFFLTNIITNIVNITSYFRREAELLKDTVDYPIPDTYVLTETIRDFLLILVKIGSLERIPIEQLNNSIHLFSQILNLWEVFILQNGINKFV